MSSLTVETTDGRRAIIRYSGEIHVAEGHFLGIELPTATGKNDGSTATPASRTATTKASRTSSIGAATPKLSSRTSMGPPSNRLSVTSPPATSSTRPLARKSTNRLSRPSIGGARTVSTSSTASPSSKTSRDPAVDNLETKIKHLEKQRAEDREKLKLLDQTKAEKDKFETIIQKLQGKCQTFHQENTELKAKAKETASELDRLQNSEAEAESILELATLDREMAEERAEQAEADLESLRKRLEEQELEIEILNSERELLTENMSDEAKEAAGYYHLQNERDRLRDALLMLKDLTEGTEIELRARIKELEDDQSQAEQILTERDEFKEDLAQKDSIIENLRQQLDAANECEEMIEELSAQNHDFKQQLADKDMVIEDLESLKELNDELEAHHLEQAQELRAEVETKDTELAEQAQKIIQQDASIADQESKMSNVESSKMMSDEQAKDVTNRFDEIMEMNRQLRTANLESIGKDIKSNLKQLEAEEASEELAIVRHYLVDSQDTYQNDSLGAYFRAKRIAYKARMLSKFMKDYDVKYFDTVARNDPITNLQRVLTMHQLDVLEFKAEQFWAAIKSATLEQFMAFGPAHRELDTIEKIIDRFLDLFSKDEAKYDEISDSIRRSNHILTGISLDYQETLETRPDNELIYRVSSMRAHFDLIKNSFEAIVVLVKKMQSADDEQNDGVDDFLVTMSHTAKISSEGFFAALKTARTLENRRNDGLYPKFSEGSDEVIEQEEFLKRTAQSSLAFARDLIQGITPEEELEESLGSELRSLLRTLKSKHFPEDEILRLDSIQSMLKSWTEHASVLMNNVEIEIAPAPWIVKAENIKLAKERTVETERKFRDLTDEHQSTLLQFREREQEIETKELEIEHLKAKHREATSKVADFNLLQVELNAAREDRDRLEVAAKQQRATIERLEDRLVAMEHLEPVERADPSAGSVADHDVPITRAQASTAFVPLVQALQEENQWLRRREHNKRMDESLKILKAQDLADEMLAMALYLGEPSEPDSIEPTEGTAEKSAHTESEEPRPPRKRTPGPILLAPISTSLKWAPMSSNPMYIYEDLEDLSFIDLSPVEEEFSEAVLDSHLNRIMSL
ncbi:hypothetical protein BU24DRAFT_431789 [Aaosphaeria arxii CBS 175.79]|uniref:CAP-Gly domain-containing protein n=1 Tax=Aaosphaeria arxii CBS 175.79 TaxID=1450172 RepID=A0A6A5XW09_9PLEO|nr:uncharacterized protein BU24DRAFT_431789 [Aaosphaeria arxii CBS 175.79]KAF2016820.1 hypothetical protein BU24DRAFT_431789 [Aaosphaeria arxii CBS 175.79]